MWMSKKEYEELILQVQKLDREIFNLKEEVYGINGHRYLTYGVPDLSTTQPTRKLVELLMNCLNVRFEFGEKAPDSLIKVKK